MCDLDICSKFSSCEKSNCICGDSLIGLLKRSKLPLYQWRLSKLRPDVCDEKPFDRLQEIKENINEFAESHSNLVICGNNTGNGKTSWAIKLLQSYLVNIAPYYYLKEDIKGVFVPTTQFVFDAKDFNGPFRERYTELADAADKADITIWDDIGAAELTRYDYTTLLVSIERRILSGKCNIFTTNFTNKEKLTQRVGNRLADRIWDTSEIIELKGRSLRR